MSLEVDALIIGGGVAGSVAASVLANHEKSVILIEKTGGTTGQSSGAIDIAFTECQSLRSSHILDSITAIAKKNRFHPYARLPQDKTSIVNETTKQLSSLVSSLELTSRPDGQNLVLATEFGSLKPTALAPKTHAFDCTTLKDGDNLLVVGIGELSSFDEVMVAKNLEWAIHSLLQVKVHVDCVRHELKMQKRLFRSSRELALSVESEAPKDLEDSLRRVIRQNKKYRACFIPPILGVEFFQKTFNWRNDEGGPLFYELLGVSQSIPGARLQKSLRQGLTTLGINRMDGEVAKALREGNRVSKVWVKQADGSLMDILPKNIILCTGRFFSGGFLRQGMRREKIFDLPLWHEDKLIEDNHVLTLSQDSIAGQQPIFRCGLRVDENFRPLDKNLKVFAHNLFAAGSSLGGYDPALDFTGLGLAAITGYMSAFRTLSI